MLNARIRAVDKQLEAIAEQHHPETKQLRQVHGVGPVIALTFILTIDRPERFQKSRAVGCFFGLKPKRRSSGGSDPQLGISKTGNNYMRSLLINAAQTILRRNSPDTDLKRWGLRLAGETKDKRLKKRAVVAVARKLAILLHSLWVTGEVYEPLPHSKAKSKAA